MIQTWTIHQTAIAISLLTLVGNFVPTSARAVDILDAAEWVFFDEKSKNRIWLDLETKIELKKEVFQEIAKLSKGRSTELDDGSFKITGKFGEILVKGDGMKLGPLLPSQLRELEEALAPLSATGPVKSRTRIEIAPKADQAPEARDLLNFLRAYLQPEHQKQLEAHRKAEGVSFSRRRSLQRGMAERILRPDYEPTLNNLFFDYYYRQTLSRMGDRRAWTLPAATVRRKVLDGLTPALIQALDDGQVRLASAFARSHGDDPLLKKVLELRGDAAPVVELNFVEPTLNPSRSARQALGIWEGARKYGYFDHDKLMQELSGMEVKTIQDLRRAVNRDKRRGNVVFRYFSGDPLSMSADDKQEFRDALGKFYSELDNSVVGFLDPTTRGQSAVHFPGVVFHRLSHHKDSVMGVCERGSVPAAFRGRPYELCNPGLVNEVLHDALANKYVENKL